MVATTNSILKALLLTFLVIASLYLAKNFLMPISIGGIIAMLYLPLCKLLEKRKLPRLVAIFICFFTIVLAIAILLSILRWQLSPLLNDFEKIKEKTIANGILLQQYVFNNLGIAIEEQKQILKTEKPSYTNIIQVIFESMKYIIANTILVSMYFFLFLYYRTHIKNFILRITSKPKIIEMEQVIYATTHVTQQYLLGLAKIIVCLWIMYSIGFGLIGVKNFIVFAIICGLLEIIPYIGNLTGTMLTVAVSAMEGASLPVLGAIILTYGIIQFIQGWVLEPLILGRQVKINPLFTILALVLGEIIWGIPGVILAIPITAMLKIICDHVDSLKPYGFLIGEIKNEKEIKSK
jgi:predicted PurR-regulated permease PerM